MPTWQPSRLGLVLWTLALLLLLSTLTVAEFEASSPVKHLTEATFSKMVMDPTVPVVLVMFYAPWCGHCKALKKPMEQAASYLKGVVPVYAVNCDEERGLCSKYEVQGYPTVKCFKRDGPRSKTKTVSDYNGQRNSNAIIQHLMYLYPSYVKVFVSASTGPSPLEQFNALLIKDSSLSKCILFTNTTTVRTSFKRLANEFHGRMQFIQVPQSEKAIVRKFGIDKFPTLGVSLSLTTGGSGERHFEVLKQEPTFPNALPFLTAHLGLGFSDIAKISTKAEYISQCIDSGSVCLIGLIDESKGKDALNFVNDMSRWKAAQKSKVKVHYAYMDAVRHADALQHLAPLAEFFNKGLPHALVLIQAKKQKMFVHLGPFNADAVNDLVQGLSMGDLSMTPFDKGPFQTTPVRIQADEPNKEDQKVEL